MRTSLGLEFGNTYEVERLPVGWFGYLLWALRAGKTTLVAALYEKFNEAPFANYLFAGSKTLVAMERRSHLARLTSGALRPDTERTLITDIRDTRFLHFCLRSADLGESHQF